jgi:hypothetical protein
VTTHCLRQHGIAYIEPDDAAGLTDNLSHIAGILASATPDISYYRPGTKSEQGEGLLLVGPEKLQHVHGVKAANEIGRIRRIDLGKIAKKSVSSAASLRHEGALSCARILHFDVTALLCLSLGDVANRTSRISLQPRSIASVNSRDVRRECSQRQNFKRKFKDTESALL